MLLQDEITFPQVPCIKTALNLMRFPFDVEFVTAMSARLPVCSGSVSDVPAWSQGFAQRGPAGCLVPPAFTHSPGKADTERGNEYREQTL